MRARTGHLNRIVGLSILSAGIAFAVLFHPTARGAGSGGEVKTLFSQKLPNAPGKTLTAILVNYAPGEQSPKHHHAGSVFAFVVSGTIRSQSSMTGPALDYKAGDSFFEPPGSAHLVSANASATEPASLLAVFVADDGAQLTTMDP